MIRPTEDRASASWLRNQIQSWPGVRVIESGDRGLRFCTEAGEFLHFHGDRQIDIRLAAEARDRAIGAGQALFHPRAHEGGWVIVRLQTPAAQTALRLAAAAYRNNRKPRAAVRS